MLNHSQKFLSCRNNWYKQDIQDFIPHQLRVVLQILFVEGEIICFGILFQIIICLYYHINYMFLNMRTRFFSSYYITLNVTHLDRPVHSFLEIQLFLTTTHLSRCNNWQYHSSISKVIKYYCFIISHRSGANWTIIYCKYILVCSHSLIDFSSFHPMNIKLSAFHSLLRNLFFIWCLILI